MAGDMHARLWREHAGPRRLRPDPFLPPGTLSQPSFSRRQRILLQRSQALELKFVLAQHYASRQQRPGRAPSLSLSQLWWIADVYDWKDTLIHSAAIPPLTSWPSDGVVRNPNPASAFCPSR